jgi:hypothetical protein
MCRCLIFESTAQGDLHEYLLTHSPKSDLAMTMPRTGESERVLDFGDMSYIAIQVASGMEYLAQHHFIHRYFCYPYRTLLAEAMPSTRARCHLCTVQCTIVPKYRYVYPSYGQPH